MAAATLHRSCRSSRAPLVDVAVKAPVNHFALPTSLTSLKIAHDYSAAASLAEERGTRTFLSQHFPHLTALHLDRPSEEPLFSPHLGRFLLAHCSQITDLKVSSTSNHGIENEVLNVQWPNLRELTLIYPMEPYISQTVAKAPALAHLHLSGVDPDDLLILPTTCYALMTTVEVCGYISGQNDVIARLVQQAPKLTSFHSDDHLRLVEEHSPLAHFLTGVGLVPGPLAWKSLARFPHLTDLYIETLTMPLIVSCPRLQRVTIGWYNKGVCPIGGAMMAALVMRTLPGLKQVTLFPDLADRTKLAEGRALLAELAQVALEAGVSELRVVPINEQASLLDGVFASFARHGWINASMKTSHLLQ